MKQLTLISLYGEKNKDLAKLISDCQDSVANTIGSAFRRYDLPQVHATIIGLEGRLGLTAYNANFAKHRGRDILMDFDGFLNYVRNGGHFPFEVQIAGFAQRPYPFRSRTSTPYLRSFSIQKDRVVLMGWPIRGKPLTKDETVTPEALVQEGRLYPLTLDTLRHGAQRFGILHDYHHPPTEVDNDFFFRIGLIDSPDSVEKAIREKAEREVRETLEQREPLVVEVRLEDVFIAAYDDNRLPLSSTQAWSLADRQVTGAFVSRLFT